MAISKITTAGVADNAITAAKIVAGAVVADVGTDGITANEIVAGAVGSSEIAANAVGSSEIADDAVLPANIAYLGDGSGNLSGTLTGEQLRFGTAFTLTDDLTVNGDVTFGKVGDDGTGQSLTQDSSANRTITGTGTLRMGSSMSGRGRLGSEVTFPTGHVIQVVQSTTNSAFSTTSVDLVDVTGMAITITPQFSSSKILLWFQCGCEANGTVNGLTIKLLRDSTIIKWNEQYSYPSTSGWNAGIAGFNYLYLDSPNTTSATTYKIQQENEASGAMHWNYATSTNGMTVIAQEIAG